VVGLLIELQSDRDALLKLGRGVVQQSIGIVDANRPAEYHSPPSGRPPSLRGNRLLAAVPGQEG
jgi:hypothetical protein